MYTDLQKAANFGKQFVVFTDTMRGLQRLRGEQEKRGELSITVPLALVRKIHLKGSFFFYLTFYMFRSMQNGGKYM